MCLLEEVLDWDSQRLLARGVDPRATSHPLRAHGRLGSALAIEYAAQAACTHGALLGALPGQPGNDAHGGAIALVASARAVQLDVPALDALADPLLIEVRRLQAAGTGALYEFGLPAQQAVARGRLALLVAHP
jgi:predicted hotdog family 3-hydroxylacyl-ACP dehydratase